MAEPETLNALRFVMGLALHADLPPGFQTAEFLLEHGLIDAIMPRKEAKEQLVTYLDYLDSKK